MKLIKNLILTFVICWLVFYVIGASVSASLNMGEWSEATRGVVFGCFGFCFILSAVGVVANNDEI